MYGIIYKTTNLVNGKIYVGQHICETDEFDGYLGSGVKLRAAIRYYGPENFKRETLRICDTQLQLDAWEMLYIKKLRSTDKRIGYNILPGSANKFGSGSPMLIPEVALKQANTMRGRKWTEEQKLAFSKARKGKNCGELNPMFGKRMSEQQRHDISVSTRRTLSKPEIKAKLSVESKRFWQSVDDEWKQDHFRRISAYKHKRVICFDFWLNIRIFDSYKDAIKATDAAVSQVCRGLIGQSKGYVFRPYDVETIKILLKLKTEKASVNTVADKFGIKLDKRALKWVYQEKKQKR